MANATGTIQFGFIENFLNGNGFGAVVDLIKDMPIFDGIHDEGPDRPDKQSHSRARKGAYILVIDKAGMRDAFEVACASEYGEGCDYKEKMGRYRRIYDYNRERLIERGKGGEWFVEFEAWLLSVKDSSLRKGDGGGVLEVPRDVVGSLSQERLLAESKLSQPKADDEEASLRAYISNVQARKELDETEKDVLIKARIGQGQFRKDLIKYWKRCAITGCEKQQVLKASHIKPWSESDDCERCDPFNGILLSPNMDALFDRCLISFDKDGILLVSKTLSESDKMSLGLQNVSTRIEFKSEHLPYLEHHRERFLYNESSLV